MREAALDLMLTLSNGIVADETLAEQLDRLAASSMDQGAPEITAALRSVVRNHRIKAMEMRGRLEALMAQYSLASHRKI